MATYETAKTQFVHVGDIAFAYRLLGQSHGIPLVCFHGFRQTMDHWDPALINQIAAQRPVFLIDNAGVGRSGGDVPDTMKGWAAHYVSVVRAVLGKGCVVDVLGYSMGGCVAQLVALNAPDMVRKLVLCGTTPSSGEGVAKPPNGETFKRIKAAMTEEEHQQAFEEGSFVQSSERSRAAGRAVWDRIVSARALSSGEPRNDNVPPASAHKQTLAFVRFMDRKNAQDGSYDRLHELRLPVLIASGCEDLVLPIENTILLWRKLSRADAQLHLYPDSGHGFLYQYADEFARLVNSFLGSSSKGPASRL